jgi:hypothetical protein
MSAKTKFLGWMISGALKGNTIRRKLVVWITKREAIKMFDKMREKLQGKKTFIVGIASVIGAISAWISGTMTTDQAVQLIITSILAMTVRSGVETTKQG